MDLAFAYINDAFELIGSGVEVEPVKIQIEAVVGSGQFVVLVADERLVFTTFEEMVTYLRTRLVPSPK
jgi:hypothetical protein